MTLETIREILAVLPGIEEGHSYGTRAFRVKKKLLARFHQKEDALVVRTTFEKREQLMQANPVTYYITDHYLNYPAMLVRLPTVKVDELRELLTESWRMLAPASLIRELD